MTATFSFEALRRAPDVEAANLVAVDATDRLLLDLARDRIGDCREGGLVVIGERYGALSLGAAALGARRIRVHQDELVGELALAANAQRTALDGVYQSVALDTELVAGAQVVLVQAPKSLDALSEVAQVVALGADRDVVVFVGGRIKHMTTAMNDVLRRSFTDVQATLARQKSRVLIAGGPVAAPVDFPRQRRDDELELTICAHGGVFAGTKLDLGTRFLLEFLDRMKPSAARAVDLGCGTGVLGAALARARPHLSVLASDQSSAAVRSAQATAAANDLGARIRVERDNALRLVATASVDLVVCNPPFHLGTTVHPGPAHELFTAAGRVLRSGGQLWTVFNSQLGYVDVLRRVVGATSIVGRNPKFTVTVSTRGASGGSSTGRTARGPGT